ncbi:unnamed protein product, partial [Plutella xylostella]
MRSGGHESVLISRVVHSVGDAGGGGFDRHGLDHGRGGRDLHGGDSLDVGGGHGASHLADGGEGRRPARRRQEEPRSARRGEAAPAPPP